ncbi:hypothetical protein FDN13_00895 [Caloramator sp. E03]|uniref:hypothetical protein n=1 Tax=Caloramator sp. E03 TaxID=2576307 RepID=UPI001110FB27|nr:hypothetical protein [Caloramator sp. E03]QCX32367.1 hypothetical protein FDN13_00895 [Caloramator sp. E03]
MNQNENIEILSEAVGYCEKLYSGMNKMVINISERNLIDIETYFKNILEGFNWVLEVSVYASRIIGEKLDLKQIQEKIQKYIDGYNNLDLLYVADVVEFELMPQVEIFYDIINRTLSNI